MNDKPLTKSDLQSLRSLIIREARKNDNVLHEIQEDVSQIKDDIKVIASELSLERNQQGKLAKTA